MNTGVIIARFQTPYLHEGQRALLEQIKAKHSKLIVVLGVGAIVGSRRSPYDYRTREKIIRTAYHDVVVLPLNDHPSDRTWSQNLDQMLSDTFPNEQFVLYGSRDRFVPHYSGRYQTAELPEHRDHQAAELRHQNTDRVFELDFREGMLYAYYNQYKKVDPTVDIAVFRSDKTEILLGKKSINNKWRLVGGFADPEDGSYEAAARRELTEECGPIEVGKLTYETSAHIDDWRYRYEADKIITTLFSCDYHQGNPQAQDDIADLAWFQLTDLSKMIERGEISEEHHGLFRHLIQKYDQGKNG